MFKTARSANIHARPPIAQIIFMLTILGLEFDPNISLRSRSGFDFKCQFRRDGTFPPYDFIEHRTGDAYHFGKPSLRKSTRLQFISQQFTRMSGFKWLQVVGGIYLVHIVAVYFQWDVSIQKSPTHLSFIERHGGYLRCKYTKYLHKRSLFYIKFTKSD